MKIVIYGGSFNPPHIGHIHVAEAVQKAVKPDRFFIIPDNIPPHKELAEGSPTAEERLKLCRMAFADIPGAEISDREILREGRSYTSDTVAEFREEYPKAELYLTIGSDMLLTFDEWRNFEYILQQCTLLVVSRTKGDREKLEQCADRLKESCKAKIRILDAKPVPMSSEELRAVLCKRLGVNAVSPSVYAEIIRKRFYKAQPDFEWLRKQSYAWLAKKRIPHVAGCEQESVKLALRWGTDPDKAAEAGILHDITKKLTYDEQLQLCEKYGIINDNAELAGVKLLHAKTGAALVKDLFGEPDDICQAIRWHTTGKPDMTLEEKILYLADYIEPTRDFPGVDRLRAVCYEDIDKAMALGLEMSLQDIRSYGEEPYKDSVEACEWYKNLIKGN